ncbi:hypothetical protein [Acinetobacter sp. MB5]|uniref:hypothetical protein n=1 Tax=Acinetobacter sp. MB5 TaxID=2069438 RepID=UPI000DD07FF7|nr:hypothetical protein [Acinetobacter sp. MB5]
MPHISIHKEPSRTCIPIIYEFAQLRAQITAIKPSLYPISQFSCANDESLFTSFTQILSLKPQEFMSMNRSDQRPYVYSRKVNHVFYNTGQTQPDFTLTTATSSLMNQGLLLKKAA